MSGEGTPACPRCGQELGVFEEAGLRLLVCRAQHGAWLDNGAAQRLVQLEFPAEVLTAVVEFEQGVAILEADAALSCPECRGALARRRVQAALLDVDVCAEHGTWFDSGELSRVAAGFEQARRDREEIRALASRPSENVYLRGLRVMPGAAWDATKQAARELADNTEWQVDERRRYQENDDLALLGVAFRVVRELLKHPR